MQFKPRPHLVEELDKSRGLKRLAFFRAFNRTRNELPINLGPAGRVDLRQQPKDIVSFADFLKLARFELGS
jgi:hypothetical protein